MVNEWGEDEEEVKEEDRRRKRLMSGHVIQRADYLSQVVFVWFVQMLLCSILIWEILNGPDRLTLIGAYPADYWLIISRFVCAIVLHMSSNSQLSQGMMKMKYALNHSYKFKNYKIPFMSGFL